MDATAPLDIGHLARDLNLPLASVERTVALLEQGNTVPFITRYRKDQTGGLDEIQIRQVQERIAKTRLLWERKQTILKSIEGQEKLTPHLAAEINSAQSVKRLEDLYLPFKPKKQSLSTLARERGLEPLAREIYEADPAAANLDVRAADFVNPDKHLPSVADVLLGVGHLIAERISEKAEIRGVLRKILRASGKIACSKIETDDKPNSENPALANEVQDQAAGELSSENALVGGDETEVPTVEEVSAEEPSDAAEKVAAETDAAEEVAAEVDSADNDAAQVESASASEVEASSTESESSREKETTSAAPESAAVVAASVSAPRSPAAIAAANAKAERKKREKLLASFKDYFAYKEDLAKVPPHRVLAINRAERAKAIRVKVEADIAGMEREALRMLVPHDHPHAVFLSNCIADGLHRLLIPSLEREIRRELTEKAEGHAVEVFARNLRKLLLQPPVRSRRVLALDPGYKSGCKVAALDQFGNVLDHAVIPVVGNEERRKRGRQKLAELVRNLDLAVVAIGNGTACRETEKMVAHLLASDIPDRDVAYCFVNEAGASVYSTSPAGREELPGFDATLRSAISIGRRLLDPLSELVKINPANIGVGLYQHDVKGKHLQTSLDAEVESCVNFVGVDVNTASPALLRYVSGLNQLSARKLYEYRCEHGPYKSREQFKEVPNIGEATFVQAAGFLKITDGENPLDGTWIHPESYEIAQKVLEKLGSSVAELRGLNTPVSHPKPAETASPAAGSEAVEATSAAAIETVSAGPASDATPVALDAAAAVDSKATAEVSSPPPAVSDSTFDTAARNALLERVAKLDFDELATELGVGRMLLQDILASLTRPGRDPRDDLPPPVFRRGIVKLEDLAPGMELMGTVLNVVDFGAFVDIGLADSGLVHISRLADRYIKDPHEVVGVGDVLKVWVVDVDMQRRRVSLTAIQPGTEKTAEQRKAEHTARAPAPPPRRPERRVPRRPVRQETPQAGAPSAGSEANTVGSAPPPRRQERSRGHHDSQRQDSQRQNRDSRPPRPAPRPQKPKPVLPITQAMAEGREPLRSFSDLAQFWAKKESDAPAESPPPSSGSSSDAEPGK